MSWAELLVLLLGIYAVLGLAVAFLFLAKGITRVDAGALHTPLAFRLLILPGCAALWPVILRKWVRS